MTDTLRVASVGTGFFSQFHHEGKAHQVPAHLLHQLGASSGGAACREEVIDDQYPRFVFKPIRNDFQTVAPVLEAVVNSDDLTGKLAGFAYGAKADARGRSECGANDEAA